MTGSYYDKNLKMCMTHSGTQKPERWSVLDQSDQSLVPCFPLFHLPTTTLNAQNMIYRSVRYTFVLRLECYKLHLSFSVKPINYVFPFLEVTTDDCAVYSGMGLQGENKGTETSNLPTWE